MSNAFDPTLVDIIDAQIEKALRNYQAPRLAVVVSYNGTARRADVLPLCGTPEIDRLTNAVTWSKPVQIPNVPIVDLGTERSAVALHLVEGDRVLLIPLMHSLDELRDSPRSTPVEPADPRQQDLMDVVALPVSWTSVSTFAAAVDRAIQGDDITLGDTFTSKALAHLDSLAALVTTFNGHTHVSAAPGSPTAVPVPLAAAAAGTANVKAS